MSELSPRAGGWRQRGDLLRARMAAAVGRPDAEVLGLLQEVGQTDWGKRQVLDAEQQPELAALLGRINGGECINPSSAWVKVTCEGRAWYNCIDSQEFALAPPPEGVQQVAEAGLTGLTGLDKI